MKYIWENMPNRNSPAQSMKGDQLLMKGEQLLIMGNWVLSPNLLHLRGQGWGSHQPGEQFQCLPNSSTGDHIDAHGSGSDILEQLGGEHGGPHHFEWGSDPHPILGECLLPPEPGYLHAGIVLFPQTLAGVMVIDGWCLPVSTPPHGL